MSSCMYTTQGILICNASNGSTSEKTDKEKMQTSFWNRIEQFNDSQSVQEPVDTLEPEPEPPKRNKIVH